MDELASATCKVCDSLAVLLGEKNKRYGDSALRPLRVFSKLRADDGISVRLDDKLSRVRNSQRLRKNDVVDIMGYLVLLLAARSYDPLCNPPVAGMTTLDWIKRICHGVSHISGVIMSGEYKIPPEFFSATPAGIFPPDSRTRVDYVLGGVRALLAPVPSGVVTVLLALLAIECGGAGWVDFSELID